MGLRVIACSAPQFSHGEAGEMALSSADPASLYNACRYAASLASKAEGAWGESNWRGTRSDRRQSTLLLSDMDDVQRRLTPLLVRVRPNLVLIGAMSICFRGAIETAKYIREFLGDDVCIVLGGRHATETIYRDDENRVRHHLASPLRLIADGKVSNCFDIVLSGDGEHFIAEIGCVVASLEARGFSPREAKFSLGHLTTTPGHWIAGTIMDDQVHTVCSSGMPLDYNGMPSPAEMFGLTTSFDVFGGAPTAHVFSDIGRGCIYDCIFCSERISVVGPPRQFKTSPHRLCGQLAAAHRVVKADYGENFPVSAFIEDSTLLGWNSALVAQFEKVFDPLENPVRLGGQATIDQIINNPALARRLGRMGLEYLFIGVETPRPELVGGLHKNIATKKGSWMERADKAVEILSEAGIKVGVSLLFGMGEGAAERQQLFSALESWRKTGSLITISMNWAVQHPLRNTVQGNEYTYLDWAVSPGPMLSLLRNFGEASEIYPIAGGTNPDEASVKDILQATTEIMAMPPAHPMQKQEADHVPGRGVA